MKNVFYIRERKNPWLIRHRSWRKNFYHKKKFTLLTDSHLSLCCLFQQQQKKKSYLFGQQRIVHSQKGFLEGRQKPKTWNFSHEWKLKTQANKMDSDVIYGNSEVKISVTIPINSFVFVFCVELDTNPSKFMFYSHMHSIWIVAAAVSFFFAIHSGSFFFHVCFSLSTFCLHFQQLLCSACCFNTIFIFTAGLFRYSLYFTPFTEEKW